MTLENAKRLLEHYRLTGNKKAEADLKKKRKRIGVHSDEVQEVTNTTEVDTEDKEREEISDKAD